MLQVGDELLARPAGEPLWDALRHAVLSQFAPAGNAGAGGSEGEGTAAQGERWRTGVRLMLAEPALAGEIVKANATAQQGLAKAIAQRTGTDADREVYPKLVAAVVAAGTAVAVEHSLREDGGEPLGAVLAQIFEQLAAGLPVP
jgi:hypothetical protein